MLTDFHASSLLTRIASALLTAGLTMSASFSPPLAQAAPRPLLVDAVSTTGMAATAVTANADASTEASAPKDLARELDTVAAELRRLRPYGSDAPSLSRVMAGVGDMNPHNMSHRIRTRVAELGDFELRVRDDWQREIEDMAARGLDASLQQAHRNGLNEFLQQAILFRALIAELDAPATRESTQATGTSLLKLAEFFAAQQSDRTYKAINADQLAIRFADGKRTPEPTVQEDADGEAAKAANDPPTDADLAETIDVQFTPAISALAAQLDTPVAIRNWVYNNVEFTPTWGSIQGADLTLLNRTGNAHDIASLTIALLRKQGVPARYVRSVVELPIERVRNWLGNLETPGMAVEMMQNGGIPTGVVVSGGSIVAVRFEHVWVEAWLDFIPSRGALNRVPDQWVPFDVAFKQYQYQANSNWRQTTFAPKRQMLIDQFVQDVTVDPTGGISGFNFDRVTDSLEGMAEQLAAQISAQNPTAKGDYLYPSREIVPIDARVFAGTLPFPLRSQTVNRYANLPDAQRHVVKLAFFADESSLRYDTPTREATIPLAQIGNQRLRVEYEGSSAADRNALQSYADSNAESLPIGSINVTPKLNLGNNTLFTGNSGRMGTQHFWTAVLRNAHGQELSGEPYRFAAGSTIAFVPNHAGFAAERLEREHANAPDKAYLPTAEALHLGAQIYWALHDHLDEQAVLSLQGHVLRMPSFGAFAQPYEVRYFFGVPRTGWQPGRVTDVKLVNAAMALRDEGNRKFAALQIGAGGSMSEGASWNILSGTTYRSIGLSAATLLARAIDEGQRIFQIDRNNVDTALQQLQLYVDAENEIRQAAANGLIIIAHEREISQSGWSGSGYVIYNPFTNGSLQRVEGGFAGGIEWGCVAVAVSLKILCDSKFLKLAKEWLERIARRAAARILANAAVMAFLGPAGAAIGVTLAILSAVELAIAVAYATMEVSRWVKGIMNGTETLTPEELAQLGINAINDIACSYVPPCLSGLPGFGGSGGPTVGNPVAVGTGAKWQTELDYHASGRFPLRFERTYNSQTPKHGSFIGTRWHATYFQRLDLPPDAGGALFPVDQRPESVLLWRPDGGWYQFDFRSGAYVAQSNIPGRLQRIVNGSRTTGWTYTTSDDMVETFDPWGRLLSIRDRAGLTHTVSRDASMRPQTVTDTYGRTLHFSYDSDTGYLSSVTDPAGRVIEFDHDPDYGNLLRVTYPDLTTRQYLYEDVGQQYGLTGIIDGRGIRTSSWTYDSLGRVKTAERASGIERYTFQYDKDKTSVTDALGITRVYEYSRIHDRPYLRKVSEPCGSCQSGAVAETIYNSQGLITAKIDFEGNRTNYTHNSRGLLEVMTEAIGTPLARETRTEWDPVRHLPVRITEPAHGGTRVTTFVYDDQGNVRTRTIQSGSETRTWTYSWQDGLLISEDGPRTDIADTFTFTYDNQGNRATTTNALGHVTRFTRYDADGRLLSSVDPNGLERKYQYDQRGRLLQIEIGPENTGPYEKTVYSYDDAGNPEESVSPDESYSELLFDGASRLIRITDSMDTVLRYELDAIGNRTKTEVLDATNQVVAREAQKFNSDGRLSELIASTGDTIKYDYDGNGNEQTITDPKLITTTLSYDALQRLETSSDALQQSISYQYDNRDNLTRVVDPRSVQSSYTFNGFDELLIAESADSGRTTLLRNQAGNIRRRTDARGTVADFTYDSLNRLAGVAYGANNGIAAVSITYNYDDISNGNRGIGRLVRASADSIVTNMKYDHIGRIVEQAQTVGNRQSTLSLSHDTHGRNVRTVLPSGAVVEYGHDRNGRIAEVRVNGQIALADIRYHALGSLQSWRYAGTASYARQFDADGRVREHSIGQATRTLSYDAAGRVRSLSDGQLSFNQWRYEYDDLDRLTGAINDATSGPLAGRSYIWTLDATGNRTSKSVNGVATNYAIAGQSNRLEQVGGVPQQFDANGNTTVEANGTGHKYDARNRLIESNVGSTTIRYSYNASGERVCKSVGPTSCHENPARTEYFYDQDGNLLGEYQGSNSTEILWVDDTPVAVLRRNPGSVNGGPQGGGAASGWGGQPAGGVEIFFVHPDHLDTPRVIVNEARQEVWRWDSGPDGDGVANQNPGGLPAFEFNLRFPGQQFDSHTQTHYNYFRDYRPDLGRYLQVDPVGVWGGLATYTYVGGNPLSFTDPDGLGARGPKPGSPKPPPRPPRFDDGGLAPPGSKYPPGGGLYMFVDTCTGEILYIGKANDFRKRYHNHNKPGGRLDDAEKFCGCGVVMMPYKLEDDPYLRDRREEQDIRRHDPPGNQQRTGRRRRF